MVMRFDDSDPGLTPQRHPRRAPEVDITAAISAMWRHKALMLFSILTALALGVVYIVITPSTYRAAVQVMIVDEITVAADGRPSTLGQNEVMLESAQKLLESQALALTVVQDLDLHEVEAFTSPAQSPIAQGVQHVRGMIADLIPAGQEPQASGPPDDRAQQIAAADALRQAIVVRREGRSSAFSIRYESTDPALAAAVVNAYGAAFFSDQLIGNVDASARVLDWLRDRLLVIQENSTEAMLRVEDFRARHGLLTVAGDPLTVQTISQLTTDLSAALVELARTRALSSVYAELREMEPIQFVESGAASAHIPDGEFSVSEQRILTLLQRLNEVERQNGPDHIEAVQLRTRIEAEGAALQREMQRMHERSLNAVRTLETQVSNLRASIAEISAENLELSQARVQLQGFERQAEIFDTLNQTYLQRLKDLEQTQTFPVTNVRVLSEAEVPKAQVAPRKAVVLALMLVLGGFVGAVLSILRARKQSVIRTQEDVQDVSMRPFFGYLPVVAGEDTPEAGTDVHRLHDTGQGAGQETFDYAFTALASPRSQYTETLRNVRVACETAAKDRPGYVLGVASIRPGEGKSSVAANLAALAAASGRSVLLVDGDLRTSGLSRRLGLSGIGLREVLMERADWRQALRREAGTGLKVLPSSFAPDDPSAGDIAASPAFRNVLNDARQHFDLMIIDLAPLGPVSDARALQPVMDGMVAVLEWGTIHKDHFRSTLSANPGLSQKLLGTVLNKTNMKTLKRYTKFDPHEGY
ncbi:MAG: GNVR domain-containing protein [Rhodobacterales bacterium]